MPRDGRDVPHRDAAPPRLFIKARLAVKIRSTILSRWPSASSSVGTLGFSSPVTQYYARSGFFFFFFSVRACICVYTYLRIRARATRNPDRSNGERLGIFREFGRTYATSSKKSNHSFFFFSLFLSFFCCFSAPGRDAAENASTHAFPARSPLAVT